MSRPSTLLATILLAAGTLAACTGADGPSPQQRAARSFLEHVGQRQFPQAAALTTDAATARTQLTSELSGLAGATGRFDVHAAHTKGTAATVDYTAHWQVPGTTARWTYTGHVTLQRASGQWRVRWAPTDLHPKLQAGYHLTVERVQPQRAALLDRGGHPLFTETPVVRVGIEPKLVQDLPKLAAQLAAVPELESTRADIEKAVRAASPTAFVPVITLRRTAYERIRTKIHELPGTVFQSDRLLLAPTARFGQPLLGAVGPATAVQVQQSHGRLRPGDVVGTSGLQKAYDRKLAGTPGVDVVLAADNGVTSSRLARLSAAHAGTAVQLTLDRAIQTAADDALEHVAKPAAIVAVQRSTGRIVADANTAATTYDYALSGAFPPGSTFKIATYTAAFTHDAKLHTSTRVPCPGTTDVDGRHFVNENEFSHPPISVSAAFAYSCNTTAIAEALRLPASALGDAARQLGLGAKWSLPVSAFSGSIPAPQGKTEQAADAIGQGRVLASPLAMALIASAADGGKVLPPSLTPGPAAAGRTVPTTVTSNLHELMRATVAMPGGTAHTLADLGAVAGKTGTAEYGNARPPRSHSWFVGVRGDLAFAVFVYDGATVDVPANPIAHRFLTALR